MHTLQTQRYIKQRSRWSRANAPEAIARRNAAADERRMALPAPIYPIDTPPGQQVGRVTIELFGRQCVVINLLQPGCVDGRRPRCDSYVGECDGEQVSGGWSAIFRAAVSRHWLTRAMSRRAIATMER